MGAITFDLLTAPHDAGVHRLLVELGIEEQTNYDHPQESAEAIASRTGPITPRFIGENLVQVARDQAGRAIGLCWCVLFDPGTGLEGEVAELFVTRAARRQGVAAALVAWAKGLFVERGVSLASVWTHPGNVAALRVYEAQGFRPTEQVVLTWLPLPDGDDRSITNNGDPPFGSP